MMGFVLSAQYVCGQAFPKRIQRISINKFLSLSFKSFPLTRKEGMTHACDVMETGSPLTSVKGMYKVIIHKQLKYKKILHSYRHNWEETTSRERAKQGEINFDVDFYNLNKMGLNQIMKFFVFYPAMVLVSCAIGVSSQCNGELESCSHGLCSDECENSNASGSGVEIIVIIMSISVALIIGLAIVLVYVCFKQGPWSQSVDAPSNESTTCDSSTGVEIPDYLMRRRFSSLSMTAGPPPYFSLFSFNLNGIGEMQSTVVGGNVGTETSNEQPPEYGILFGNSPPPYEHVVKISQLLKPLETGTTVITTAG